MSGAVDSGEVLDPLSLVFKTEKTIQCVIFVVSTSKRQQAAENCYSYLAFFISLLQKLRWDGSSFRSENSAYRSLRSINLRTVRVLHVSSSWDLLRILQFWTKIILKTSKIFLKVTSHLTAFSCNMVFADLANWKWNDSSTRIVYRKRSQWWI